MINLRINGLDKEFIYKMMVLNMKFSIDILNYSLTNMLAEKERLKKEQLEKEEQIELIKVEIKDLNERIDGIQNALNILLMVEHGQNQK